MRQEGKGTRLRQRGKEDGGCWGGTGSAVPPPTHSGCDCLSSGAPLPGLGSRHLQRRPTASPREAEAASRPYSLPQSHPWDRGTPASPAPRCHHGLQPWGYPWGWGRAVGLGTCCGVGDTLWGWGRTCQLSLLGEVGGAGAAGDPDERGGHLGVPAVHIHVTAGHRQLESKGTGGSAPSGAGREARQWDRGLRSAPWPPGRECADWAGIIVFPGP